MILFRLRSNPGERGVKRRGRRRGVTYLMGNLLEIISGRGVTEYRGRFGHKHEIADTEFFFFFFFSAVKFPVDGSFSDPSHCYSIGAYTPGRPKWHVTLRIGGNRRFRSYIPLTCCSLLLSYLCPIIYSIEHKDAVCGGIAGARKCGPTCVEFRRFIQLSVRFIETVCKAKYFSY